MNQEKIGEFIASCRKEVGLTQREFAEKIGVTDKTVSRWENGHYLPDISLFKEICEILGISVLEFMDGEKIGNKKILEKVDDLLIKNVEESGKKNKRDMLYVVSCIISLLSLFFLFTMNAYREFRTILIIVVLMIFVAIFFFSHKTLYKKHMLIPFVLLIVLFGFDYIAVNNYNVEPILAINTENDTYSDSSLTYRKYRGLFYVAYKCIGVDDYVVGRDMPLSDYCFENFYKQIMAKAATIQASDGYIYYMQLVYSGGMEARVLVTMTAFDLDTVFENIPDNPFIKDAEEQEKFKKQLKGPMGDCCATDYVSLDMKNDFDKIFAYFYDYELDGEITLKDLDGLKLTSVDTKDIVSLYNKALKDGADVNESYSGYAMYKNEDIINGIEYQLKHFTLNGKIEYVKISVKADSKDFDRYAIDSIEKSIIATNGFKIDDVGKNHDYSDLYKFLENISYIE